MKTKNVDYLNGKLFPMILKFSIPAAISLLITAIYNILKLPTPVGVLNLATKIKLVAKN